MADSHNNRDPLPEKQQKQLVSGLFSSVPDAELIMKGIMDDDRAE